MRSKDVGGKVSDTARAVPPNPFEKARRVVLLVHGFNVSLWSAQETFEGFERNLEDGTYDDTVRVYWPGDTKYLSRASYLKQPSRALRCGELLAEQLAQDLSRRAGPDAAQLEIVVVAHSLGCRLTLEFLRIVWGQTQLRIPLVVLMAAAVPRYTMRPQGSYGILIRNLPRIWVLHSSKDSALGSWFRLGQLPERPWGSSFRIWDRGALGKHGLEQCPNIESVKGDWDHGDYWPDRDIAAAMDDQLSTTRRSIAPLERLRQRYRRRDVMPRTIEGRVPS